MLKVSRSFSGTCLAVQASTKDGELVVRPKLTLGDSTNVGDLREFNSYSRSIVRWLCFQPELSNLQQQLIVAGPSYTSSSRLLIVCAASVRMIC